MAVIQVKADGFHRIWGVDIAKSWGAAKVATNSQCVLLVNKDRIAAIDRKTGHVTFNKPIAAFTSDSAPRFHLAGSHLILTQKANPTTLTWINLKTGLKEGSKTIPNLKGVFEYQGRVSAVSDDNGQIEALQIPDTFQKPLQTLPIGKEPFAQFGNDFYYLLADRGKTVLKKLDLNDFYLSSDESDIAHQLRTVLFVAPDLLLSSGTEWLDDVTSATSQPMTRRNFTNFYQVTSESCTPIWSYLSNWQKVPPFVGETSALLYNGKARLHVEDQDYVASEGGGVAKAQAAPFETEFVIGNLLFGASNPDSASVFTLYRLTNGSFQTAGTLPPVIGAQGGWPLITTAEGVIRRTSIHVSGQPHTLIEEFRWK